LPLSHEYGTVSEEGVDKKNSQLGRYYGDFSPNYFEYRLRDTGKMSYTEPSFVYGLPSSDPCWIFQVREYSFGSGYAILKYGSGSKRPVKITNTARLDPIWTFCGH
jgi:hypothetical protein